MLTSRSLARCLVFLSVNALVLSGAAARQDHALAFPTPVPVAPRAIFPPFGGGAGSGTETGTSTDTLATSTSATSTSATSSATSTSTSDTATSTSGTSTSTSDTATSTSASATSSSTSATTSATSAPITTPPPASPTVSASVTTNAQGVETTVFMTLTPTLSDTSSASATSAGSSSGTSTKSSGISKSTIIGLSVSGGVALIGLVTFIVWKFTRKRFTDDDFDNEAIKWPELNAHGDDIHAPLPTNRTGGAGFETPSQVNLARPDSRAGSIAPSAAASSVELFANRDPYAVPPLPHLNPNMPYRDDPSQVYYDNDPYAQAPPPGEAYPMTQINRGRSPGPQMAMQGGFDARVASPAPQALGADYRARSPGPAMSLYSGRASPGPQAGRMSPGPQMAYGQGGGY